MLGILLIYFIGRYFYRLAEKFNQNKWLYAILGIATYYAGTFIGGFVLVIIDDLFAVGIDWENNLLLEIIALPFGIGLVYLLHFLLYRKWQKTVILIKDEIQDIGKSTEELEKQN